MAWRSGQTLDYGAEYDDSDFEQLKRNGDRYKDSRFTRLSFANGPVTTCFCCERRQNECCQYCHVRRQNRESDDLTFRDAGMRRTSAHSFQHRELERCTYCAKILTAADLEYDRIPECYRSLIQGSDSDRHCDRSPMTTHHRRLYRKFQCCIPHFDGQLKKNSRSANDLCHDGMTYSGHFIPRGCSSRDCEIARHVTTSQRNSQNHDGSWHRLLPLRGRRSMIYECNCSCRFCVESRVSDMETSFSQLGSKEPPISPQKPNNKFPDINLEYSEKPVCYPRENAYSYISPDYTHQQCPYNSYPLLPSFHHTSRFHNSSSISKFDPRGGCDSTSSNTSDGAEETDLPVHEGLPISTPMNQEQERNIVQRQKVDEGRPQNKCLLMKSQTLMDFQHTKRFSGRTPAEDRSIEAVKEDGFSQTPLDHTRNKVVKSCVRTEKHEQNRKKAQENPYFYMPHRQSPFNSDHHYNRLPQSGQHNFRFYHQFSTSRKNPGVDCGNEGSHISDAEMKVQGLSISDSTNQEQGRNISQCQKECSPMKSQTLLNCELSKMVSSRTCAASDKKYSNAVTASTNQGQERNIVQRQKVDGGSPEDCSPIKSQVTADFKSTKRSSEITRSSNDVIRRRLKRYKNPMVEDRVFQASDHVLKELKKVLEERGRWNGN